MNRTGVLAAVAVMLASSPSFGQYGGMGGMGGGMGGQGTAPGMMMQGARYVGGVIEVRRSVQVEMEGGHRLSGKIDLRTIIVDGDLGRYTIAPSKIKAIRFLKPVVNVKPANEPAANENGDANGGNGNDAVVPRAARQNRAAVLRASRVGGGGFGGFEGPEPTRGKVITTTDKEIVGTIHLPMDFRLELDFGTLALAPAKLRSMTFTDDHREDKSARARDKAPGASNILGRSERGIEATVPGYIRHGGFIVVISPIGDRVTLYNVETKKSESLELSGSKDDPLIVTAILGQDLVALMMSGPKVTRIAVGDFTSGTWHSRDLRKPVDGRAVPIVASGVVVYNLGQHVYAYGSEAQRWDVAELPEGIHAIPSVASGTATIESDGHIYTFTGKTGKWNHVDVRAILDGNTPESASPK